MQSQTNPARQEEKDLTTPDGQIAGSKSRQEASSALEGRVVAALDNMLEGCQVIGPDWRYLYVNDAVVRHGRTTKENLLGKTMMEAYPGIEDTEAFAAIRRCMEERAATLMDNEFTFPDGAKGWFQLHIQPVPEGVLILSIDVTASRLADQRLRRLSRALKTLSSCNHVIMRATDESRLLRDVCRVIVKAAGYRLAWIGLARQDPEKTVEPVAQAGYSEEYVPQTHITWSDSPRGQGPTGRAIRSGQLVVCRDILTDPRFSPWRDQALRFGYGSSIALPLITADEVLGALNIYAPEPDAFDSEETKLLQELADDVAYGTSALRTRALAEALNDELRDSERKYRLHFEQISDVVCVLDKDFRIDTISPSVERLLGYDPQSLIGSRFTELGVLAPRDMEAAASDAMGILNGGQIDSAVYEFRAADGTTKYGEVSAAPVVERGEIQGLIAVIRDTTDRVRAEQALEQSLRRLKRAFGGTIRTLRQVVESRDPYTAGHQRRVTHLARAMAMEAGLSPERVEGLRVAASIHDLGKIFVPAEILTKAGSLTKIELTLIQNHPTAAYKILKKMHFPWPVAEIILQHHERMDGSGYPRGIPGDQIIMEARLLMVADVVEAMGSHRPYRPTLGLDKALEEISRQRDVLYDALAVDVCLRLFHERGFELD